MTPAPPCKASWHEQLIHARPPLLSDQVMNDGRLLFSLFQMAACLFFDWVTSVLGIVIQTCLSSRTAYTSNRRHVVGEDSAGTVAEKGKKNKMLTKVVQVTKHDGQTLKKGGFRAYVASDVQLQYALS